MTPAGMTPKQFDDLVYQTLGMVDVHDATHVAFALGRAGVLTDVSQAPMVEEAMGRLVKAGRL